MGLEKCPAYAILSAYVEPILSRIERWSREATRHRGLRRPQPVRRRTERLNPSGQPIIWKSFCAKLLSVRRAKSLILARALSAAAAPRATEFDAAADAALSPKVGDLLKALKAS